MGDSNSWKPGSRPGGSVPPAKGLPPAQGPAVGQKPAAMGEKPMAISQNSPGSRDQSAGQSGRVIHDERGNAIWDWIKETSRIAIDSTSRLLRRLEVPELKMEDTQAHHELSIESDRDAGGGYDPYGGSAQGKSPGARGGAGARGAESSGRARGSAGGANAGGGYDPYGKGVTRKPGHKP